MGDATFMERNIAVVGLGYVGLPVAVTFGNKHKVIGFDINESRIQELKIITIEQMKLKKIN